MISIQDGARALAMFALQPHPEAFVKVDWLARRIVQGVLDDLADLKASGTIRETNETTTPASELPPILGELNLTLGDV